MNPLLLIGIGVVLGFILLLVALLGGGKPSGEDLIEERTSVRPDKAKKKEKEKGGPQSSAMGRAVDRAVAGRGFAQNIATQLARADMQVNVGEFILMSVTLGLGLPVLFLILKRPVLMPVGVLVGLLGPRLYVGFKQGQRLKTFNAQIGDGLNLIVNSLRAGYSTMQAMEVISKEMPQPIAKEFGRVVLELQLGLSFDDAMLNMLRRVPSADMDLVVTAMNVQREVGGNLAEVLDSISFTIRERVRIKGEIGVLTAQGRITGYVITGIPFFLGVFIYTINPDYMGPMIEEPCGWGMLGASVVLIALGYFVINKIVSIEI